VDVCEYNLDKIVWTVRIGAFLFVSLMIFCDIMQHSPLILLLPL
jgi:hypothetical protein